MPRNRQRPSRGADAKLKSQARSHRAGWKDCTYPQHAWYRGKKPWHRFGWLRFLFPAGNFFPALAALVSIYGLIAEPSDVQSLIDITSRVIPGDANKILADELTTLIHKPSGGLTFGAVLGFYLCTMERAWRHHPR